MFIDQSCVEINNDVLTFDFKYVRDFEKHFLKSVANKSEICEILRLTISEKKTLLHFFNTLKEIGKKQSHNNTKISFWITQEIPLILLVKAVKRISNIKFFLLTSSSKIGNDTYKTCKGLCVTSTYYKGSKKHLLMI